MRMPGLGFRCVMAGFAGFHEMGAIAGERRRRFGLTDRTIRRRGFGLECAGSGLIGG
jgi:hypothetical protein